MNRISPDYAARKQQKLSSIHDRSDPNSDGVSRNGSRIFEEPCVIPKCLLGQGFDSSSRTERGAWFVESYMSVRTEPKDLKIDSFCFLDLFLLPFAMSLDVSRQPTWDMDVAMLHIDVLEKVLHHEIMVALALVG